MARQIRKDSLRNYIFSWILLFPVTLFVDCRYSDRKFEHDLNDEIQELLPKLSTRNVAFEDVDSYVKRQNNGGSCTCTCETKPQQWRASPHRGDVRLGTKQSEAQIETASLIRTDAKSNSAAGTKPYELTNNSEEEKKSNNSAKVKTLYNDVIQSTDDKSGKPVTTGDKSNRPQENNWVQGSRYPWRHLQDRMCFRDACKSERDCCMRYSLCDRSAKVCVDCWYGSTCLTEQECCYKYPYCKRVWKTGTDGKMFVESGKCVTKL